VSGADVCCSPLHGTDDQILLADEAGYAVLHQAIAQSDESLRKTVIAQRPECGFEVRRFESQQCKVKLFVELGRIGVGLNLHVALLAEFVQQEAGIPHPLDVLLVRIEHGDPLHRTCHLRRSDPADSASSDDEHARLDHYVSPSRPASIGGNRSSSSLSAA
jgi:hypothetical protein